MIVFFALDLFLQFMKNIFSIIILFEIMLIVRAGLAFKTGEYVCNLRSVVDLGFFERQSEDVT